MHDDGSRNNSLDRHGAVELSLLHGQISLAGRNLHLFGEGGGLGQEEMGSDFGRGVLCSGSLAAGACRSGHPEP